MVEVLQFFWSGFFSDDFSYEKVHFVSFGKEKRVKRFSN